MIHSSIATEPDEQRTKHSAARTPRTGREAAPACPAAPLLPTASRSHWAKRLLGALALRVCASGKKDCSSASCQFRVYCKCAREDLEASAALETKSYGVLAICGLAGILYWFVGI